jgi:transcription elongation factor GreA
MKKDEKPLNLLTKEGLEKIKKEIEYRENELRSELAETLNEMRDQGDLRENDGYTLAVEENEQNEEEIARLKDLILNSKIVKKKSKNKVDVGSIVTISYNGNKDKVYTIVGEDNANPLKQKISYKSPIGSSLMGKKVGDDFKLQAPQGEVKCKITKID